MMIKRCLSFALLFIIGIIGFCQGEFNNWYFGVKAGVSFNSGNPVSLTNGQMSSPCVTVSVSDSLGLLLFYSHGCKVFNRMHNIMPNGDNLFCNNAPFNQPVLAVKKLDDDSSYYLFTVDNYSLLNPYLGLHYSIVNMRLDGGLGDIEVLNKNILVPGGNKAWDVLTGARHKNNRNIWIVVKLCDPDSNYYASYLLSSSGLDTIPMLSESQITQNPLQRTPSEIKISPDGTKFICSFGDTTEFCLFNAETGFVDVLFQFTTPYSNGIPTDVKSMEFSIDSKFLYISASSLYTNNIYQYDVSKMDSVEFISSAVFIGQSNGYSALQLGPDYKIYGTINTIDSLNVIHNPSIPGLACNYQVNAVSLGGRDGTAGLPQFIQRYYAYIQCSGQCQNNPVSFSFTVWPQADSVWWNFGDPPSGASNFSTDLSPSHTYSSPGQYTVMFIVKHIDNRFDTAWQVIQILPSPQPNLGLDITICQSDTATFDAGFSLGCTYQWANLTTGQPNIGTGQTYKTGETGIYMVTVTGSNGCSGRDTVQLFTSQVPVVTNSPLSKSICSGEPTNIPLTSNVPGTEFYWTATLNSGIVAGFSADSGLVINQTLVNTGLTAGIVTYHITPNVGSCMGDTVHFPVIINIGDSVKVSITASLNNVCAGTSVNFTAIPTNPGANPVYQWKVNSVNSGTNSPNFTYTSINGDVIKCVLTSSNTVCTSNNPATSTTITMIVNPNQPVSVSVTPSANPVCEGTSVIYTATPTYSGTTPQYQWQVNGFNVGINNPTYASIPNNGDIVTVTLTSSELCTSGSPASSIPVLMTVNPNLPVSVNITVSNNPVCSGIPVTFTTTSTNGGSSPVYQWTVNSSVAGSNSPELTYSPLNGDIVNCSLISNIPCPTGNPSTSNPITITIIPAPVVTFTSCFDTITTLNAKPIKLKGGIPLNGTYSGPGVNSTTGAFTPSMAGIGLKTITYSYTNVSLCSASKNKTILVQSAPSFTCGNNLTDIRDNKVYPTIQIGSQCWMATNLNYGTIVNSSQLQYDNCVSEKYCYNNLNSNCSSYGGLYWWDELMQYDGSPANQGLCPPGWHIPTESEWTTQFFFYSGSAFAGKPLQDSIIAGFRALTGGVFYMSTSWNFTGFATLFWSSTSWGATKALSHGMNTYNYSVSLYPSLRSNAFSVRCIKDQ